MFNFPIIFGLFLRISPIVSFPQLVAETGKNEQIETACEVLESEVTNSSAYSITGRASDTNKKSYWPNGVVPINFGEHFEKHELDLVHKAMDRLEEVACVEFTWASSSDKNWVSIVKSLGGCKAAVGKAGGKQTLQLDENCFTQQVILHELMHSLGFHHEHERHDRDKYVTIHLENIKKEMHRWYDVMSEDSASTYGIPYDYASIMHYSDSAFAKSYGLKTFEPKFQTDVRIGHAKDLSKYDIQRLNTRYPCKNKLPKVSNKRLQ